MARTADQSAAELGLDLSAAQHVWLTHTSLALLLKSGQMVLAHLTVEAGFVKQMKVSASLSACLVIRSSLALLLKRRQIVLARLTVEAGLVK